ncbi:MAG: murein biosynthesis integral membrane protein MurJ [Acidobacteria bacterium]|nr:murein biosynthesis integral membrane protein MurJ [Acidobacteriota bacterium]
MTRPGSAGRNGPRRAAGGAARVAAGMLASRVLGLVREAVVASLAGVGALMDVVSAAFRAPNVLQNLLGDQALSASFIPVYSRMVAEGRRREAGALAGAMFGLLFAAMGLLSLLGFVLAPLLVRLLLPGFVGDAEAVAAGMSTVDRLALTTTAVRICIPMAAAITLSAWCLGILNSHRRFLLPYLAPCFWNASVIGVVWFVAAGAMGGEAERIESLALAVCWGGLLGGLLQFAVQLPSVLRVTVGLRPSLSLRAPGVRKTLTNLWPAIAGRGVGQLGAYVDLLLGSLLAQGALGALALGQRLYLLPIGLFGVSVAAAELPELARLRGDGEDRSRTAAARARASLAAMSFLVSPTLVGYLALGIGIVGAVYRRGEFGVADQWLVFFVLAAYSLGLLASSASRLLQSVFFSFGDTRSPARIAAMRLAVAAGLGAVLMIWLDRISVVEVAPAGWLGPVAPEAALRLGAVGLALASAAGSWLELALLLRRLRRREVPVRAPWRAWGRHLPLAMLCLAPWAATQTLVPGPPWIAGVVPVVGFAVTYLVAANALKVPEARTLRRWLLETRRRSST